jgi:hypothetical protein
MKRLEGWALVVLALALPTAALAGPPFLTDDPEPTDTGHWEIYAPLAEAEGRHGQFDGALGAEINYGAAHDVQVTLGLPAAFAHGGGGWHWGRGDVEASVKYRFFHDESAALSIAAFPGVTLPTAAKGFGADHVTALLPIWAQKDLGEWSVFGGGGYAINPGAGNRDYWTGGVAVSRAFGERLLLGIEVDRDGSDAADSGAATSVGVGAILTLRGALRVLASAGPTFVHGQRAFHAFAALGLDL